MLPSPIFYSVKSFMNILPCCLNPPHLPWPVSGTLYTLPYLEKSVAGRMHVNSFFMHATFLYYADIH